MPRAPTLLLHPCEPPPIGCGAPVRVECVSKNGKPLPAGHVCRRNAAKLAVKPGTSGGRGKAATREEVEQALLEAADAGRGIRLSAAEVQLLVRP